MLMNLASMMEISCRPLFSRFRLQDLGQRVAVAPVAVVLVADLPVVDKGPVPLLNILSARMLRLSLPSNQAPMAQPLPLILLQLLEDATQITIVVTSSPTCIAPAKRGASMEPY